MAKAPYAQLRSKLSHYPTDDKKAGRSKPERMSLDDVLSLSDKFDNKCYVCGDVLLFEYTTSCLHQFTLDRLDASLPHTIDNVVPCCYYCNCREVLRKTGGPRRKECASGCHELTRLGIRIREEAIADDYDDIMRKKFPTLPEHPNLETNVKKIATRIKEQRERASEVQLWGELPFDRPMYYRSMGIDVDI